MTTTVDLAAELAKFVGRKGATMVAPDPVNAAMIRHWCTAMGDLNPVYQDEAAAGRSVFGGIIAPPAMLQAWTMPGYNAAPAGPDAIADLYALLDAHGYSSIVATDSEQEYLRPLRLGDRIAATKTIAAISTEKSTGLGKGFFITSEIDIVDQNQQRVGRQLHRVLKFKPPRQTDATAAGAAAVNAAAVNNAARARRPRPNVTLDTRFFFDGARARQLLIQKCNRCGTLQHPPTAACSTCHSFDLGSQQASGRATLYSYTVVHAPVVPPFKAPYVVALVALEEGTRLVSELVDIAPAEVRIGMPLVLDFAQVDDELVLPVFRRAPDADHLPHLAIALDRSFIVASAIATRDYQPVHHDPDVARQGGSEDVFMNILTSQGLVGRYITDWAGPDAVVRKIAIRLGASNYPGDTMVMSGKVTARSVSALGQDLEVAVLGRNSRGDHIKGTVTLTLPVPAGGAQ